MSALELSCPDTAAQANATGAYALSWRGPEDAVYRLVEESAEKSSVVYQGRETASTITGRPAGSYRYKLGVVESGAVSHWAEACSVRVEPHSPHLVGAIFAVGLFVTAATVVLVVRGHLAHSRGELG